MRTLPVQPTGKERTFGEDEIIVSKTDLRGIITYANQVFLRVSGYTEEELLGKPHNIIRHPEMPRSVFKLLWDKLARREEVFAYVNNLAKDGANYWVLAHVTPSFDAVGRVIGYHSSRRRPERAAIDAIIPIYTRLLAEERRATDPRTGMMAGEALLGATLEAAHVDYEEFVFSI
jgi:PAS domain S-box-containing protein